jgi:hypothetical protein
MVKLAVFSVVGETGAAETAGAFGATVSTVQTQDELAESRPLPSD